MDIMTSKEFVHTLVDIWNSSDRRICFVLGAGASKSSGIRTGGELAAQWLKEIEERSDASKFEKFLADSKVDKNNPAASYPEIYKERYKFDIDTGFDFINREMEKARPGYGYSVLAQILADRQHNIVITTNFDNLTEDALYTYSSKRPLICGHESLAIFAKPSVKRPLIVKIHRDRFFNPQSQPEEIERMNELWIEALNNIFSTSTPVFIGYGGNDGSLMDYMQQVNLVNNLFWCERIGSKVSDRVKNLLEKRNGKLVEIEGFDELMFSLQDGLKLKLLDGDIVEIAQNRSKEYKETVQKIRSKQASSPDIDVQKAAKRIIEKAGDSWWSYELKVQSAKTNREKEAIYRQGIKNLPNSAELHGNFANFLTDILKKHREAGEHYRKALKLDPEDADYNANYASYLSEFERNYDEAEKYFRIALELNSKQANINGNFALFLYTIRKEYNEAEKYYRKALDIDPKDANNNGLLANFLKDVRKNYNEAEKYYRKALEIDPEHINNNSNFALFLTEIKQDYKEAEKYYNKALKLDPEDPTTNGNFALFLTELEKYDEAEKYYRKALRFDADNANNNENFAIFLNEVRRDYTEAEKYYWKALLINPDDADYNNNYAIFLKDIKKDFSGAEKYYRKALEIDPQNLNNIGNFAVFLNDAAKNYAESEKYYLKALEIDPEQATNNGNFAGFLFSQGRIKEAMLYFTKAFNNCEEDTPLFLELLFYKYAHIDDDKIAILSEIKDQICIKETRSLEYNLQMNVDSAIEQGHSDPATLQLIADIITKDADATSFCKK